MGRAAGAVLSAHGLSFNLALDGILGFHIAGVNSPTPHAEFRAVLALSIVTTENSPRFRSFGYFLRHSGNCKRNLPSKV
jgi:hypothetical protein